MSAEITNRKTAYRVLWVFIAGSYAGIAASLKTDDPRWALGASVALLVYVVFVTIMWREG